MDLCQSLARAAALRPYALAIIDGDLRQTWRETADRVARIAAGLDSRGVAQGDRVAILAGNSSSYYECLFALFSLGAVAVPLNTRLAVPELAFQTKDAGARILLSEAGFAICLPSLRSTGIECVIDIAAKPGLGEAADVTLDELAANTPLACRSIAGSAPAGIFYTGGTTGRPKGVIHTHASLHAMACGLVMQLQLDESCVVLHSAPMFHLADFATFVVTLVAGSHVFIPSLDDASLLNAIELHGVTHSFTVPAVIERIARAPDIAARNLSRLKVLGYGGAPMPWGAFLHARAALPGIEFVQGFGMTEMPALTFLGARHHREDADERRLRSAGQPGYAYEVRVVDEAGADVPRGTLGEIIGRGDNVMQGYWNRPEETAAALRQGWMHSGDAGFMDEDGFVTITDRFKDMIVTGGENVYSIEVENVLSTHPSVRECAVIGVPDTRWGERVHAIVVPHPGMSLDTESMIGFFRGKLAGYKIPRSLDLRDAPLPRSAAGKVLKADLRQRHWHGADKQV